MSKKIREILTSRWLPWGIVGATLGVALLHETLQFPWLSGMPRAGQAAFWLFMLLGLLTIYLAYSRYSRLVVQRDQLISRLDKTELRVVESYQRLDAIFQVSQKFVEASDENEVIEPVLSLLVNLTGAQGASFVPLDEHGQPQAALSHGELPFPVMEAWVEYLASPGVRERCRNCEIKDKVDSPKGCPLLQGPFAHSAALICVPVRRGQREFGVMTLFLGENAPLDEWTRVYLHALLDEMALGLEGVYLRRRELSALRQIQVLRQKADLLALLNGLLDNVYDSLEADFAILLVPQTNSFQSGINLTKGELPAQARLFIDGVVQGVMASGEPILLGNVAGDPDSPSGVRSLLAAPLLSAPLLAAPLQLSERSAVGVILMCSFRTRSFHQRQLALLQTVAGQAALVVQNASLMAELEYKTMIQERARLAREIHDGLAQTIGFLKLQAAQLRNYFARGESERARQSFDRFYTTLSEAYQDARQAIDGLRISPAESGLNGWLEQVVSEFQESSGLTIALQEVDVQTNLPPEIQAQLLRIIQEALSNVRKHAQAGKVWIACREATTDLLLEVRDDGLGFSPEDVASASRHGLRGMRERADLIGADFQVISRPRDGTVVRLRLPLKDLREEVV